MANLMDLFQQHMSPEVLQQVSQQIGAEDHDQTAAAASGIFSTILGGLAKNASTPEGAESLEKALERDHDGSILDVLGAVSGGQAGGLGGLLGSVLGGGQQAQGGLGGLLGSVLGGGQSAPNQSSGGGVGDLLGMILQGGGGNSALNGAGILGHILGGRQDAAAGAVSQASGLNVSQVMKLMPILAPIVMGVLGRARQQNGIGAGDLASVLGGASQQAQQKTGFGGGILNAILDKDGDGSFMDDLAGMAGKQILGGLFKR